MKRWSNEEIKLSINLFNDGKSFKEISTYLICRTERTVQIKLNKLGYISNKRKHIINNCLQCGDEIETTIGENKHFCSKSCSASYNNVRRKKLKKTKICKNCGNLINGKNIYCNNICQNEYQRNQIFKKIELGIFQLKNKETESKWLKKYLIEKHGNKCMKCGWGEVHLITGKVPIQINHIDGHMENNKLNNVELLCPNCHSLTENFGSLNKGNGRLERKIQRLKQKEKYGFYE